MKLGYNLRIEQTQKLVMTPELQQAITLLQCSSMELADYISKELVSNPLLEVQDKEEEDTPSMEEKMDWEAYLKEDAIPPNDRVSREKRETTSFENFVSRAPSLRDVLLEQLHYLSLEQDQVIIAEYLIGNIDENGYLRETLAEAALQLGCSQEQVASALKVVQSLDPAGVGARDLRECLLLQLRCFPNHPPLVRQLIEHHLDDVAENRLRKVSHCMEVSLTEVQEAMDFIRKLNPKPGNLYGGEGETRYVVPDVLVEKVDDEYMVLVNETTVPYLQVNSFYRNLMTSGNQEISEYIKNKLDSALWLIRSIEQRRLTLYKVASKIFEIQRPFLDHGISHLRPLTLKDVAEQVGVHESTVSRATSNKYVQTPRGIFPLKYFFTGGVDSSSGFQSSTSIKAKIKELIQQEDPVSPLSDNQLASLLQQSGIEISRRTVAKYREEIGIAASHKRRRLVVNN